MGVYSYVGFTGSRKGMTPVQQEKIRDRLMALEPYAVHHGDCIGADQDFHLLVQTTPRSVFTYIHIHPPADPRQRAWCSGTTVIFHRPEPYLVRNHTIVQYSGILLAAPSGMQEILRSGTWATIRYAVQLKKRVEIFFPDGSVQIK